MTPQVSIVVAAHNARGYLADAVRSVQLQTVTDWELVVVDDGSQDETFRLAQVLEATESRMRVISIPHGGVSVARNRGVAACNSKSHSVLFLDADDMLEPFALEALLSALGSAPQAVAAHALGRFVDSDGRPIQTGELESLGRVRRRLVGWRTVHVPIDAPTTFYELVYRNCFPVGAVLVRRQSLADVGGFDLHQKACEDWVLWLRLSLCGEMAFLDRVVMRYRQHPDSVSNRRGPMIEARRRVRRRVIRQWSLPPRLRQAAKRSAIAFQLDQGTLRLRQIRRHVMEGRFREAANASAGVIQEYAVSVRFWFL